MRVTLALQVHAPTARGAWDRLNTQVAPRALHTPGIADMRMPRSGDLTGPRAGVWEVPVDMLISTPDVAQARSLARHGLTVALTGMPGISVLDTIR